MATISGYSTQIARGIAKTFWETLTDGDSGNSVSVHPYAGHSVQVTGTFGSTTLEIHGSDDGTNFERLAVFKEAGIQNLSAAPAYVKPVVQGTDATADLDVTIVSRQALVNSGRSFPDANLGYQQISAATLAAATALTVPTGANMALITPETASVVWRDDGTDPTAAIGMPLAAGTTLEYTGQLSRIKFILLSGSPKLNVSYYRVGG